jgi:biotin carboxyl carrier protein
MKIKVKIEDQTFEVHVGDLNTRPIQATVDGQTVEVWPEESPRTVVTVPSITSSVPVAAPVPNVAAHTPAVTPVASTGGAKTNAVTAPIPGVIVTVAVKDGDSVKKGQELCVLEAMKMKNSIRSNRDGIIGAIKVKVGDHVQHNQVLIEYKD